MSWQGQMSTVVRHLIDDLDASDEEAVAIFEDEVKTGHDFGLKNFKIKISPVESIDDCKTFKENLLIFLQQFKFFKIKFE